MPITLVKLGGSLLTDKRQPETDRPSVIARLAQEIAAALPQNDGDDRDGGLIVGHGSGSFGHVAAAHHEIHRGLERPDEQRPGVSLTQQRAAELHRRVVGALSAALEPRGTGPFSIAPSSALVTASGRPVSFSLEPLVRALTAGLVPVVYGDVVMDRDRGCAICSTERVFDALVDGLPEHGLQVSRILWLGETEGVWGSGGQAIPRITPDTAEAALGSVGGSAGTDVTGGMRHRVETALELARRGITSWIGDGREPGRLRAALVAVGHQDTGREEIDPESVAGTWVVPEVGAK